MLHLEDMPAPPGLPGHRLKPWELMEPKGSSPSGSPSLTRDYFAFYKRFRSRPRGAFQGIKFLTADAFKRTTQGDLYGTITKVSTDQCLSICELVDGQRAMLRQYTSNRPVRYLWHEVNVWSSLAHPNIARFLGVAFLSSVPNAPPSIVSAFYPEGSLYEENARLKITPCTGNASPPHRPSEKLMVWAMGVAMGMSHLHAHPAVHRNLKSTNVMLTERGEQLVITDMGCSRPLEEDMTPATGSLRWLAPELGAAVPYGSEADVFSYGMLLLEMVTFAVPYACHTATMAAVSYVHGKRPPIPDASPTWFAEVIERCWQQDPSARPTFLELVDQLDRLKRPRCQTPMTQMTQMTVKEPPADDEDEMEKLTGARAIMRLWLGNRSSKAMNTSNN